MRNFFIIIFVIRTFLKILLCQVKSISKKYIFGVSQDPITENYVLVFEYNYLVNKCKQCYNKYTNKVYKWCKPCEINYLKKNFIKWTNGNKQIDDFIQRRQLEINYTDVLFEWVSYDQFSDVKEIGKIGFTTVYSAVWKDGPLYYDYFKEWTRESDKKIILKYFLQNLVDELLNEVRISLSDEYIFGVSQDPNTKNYILVFEYNYFESTYCRQCGKKYTNMVYKWCKPCEINDLKKNFIKWTSGNKQIDDFIQKRQLEINYRDEEVFEWIPYNQFNDVVLISKNDLITIYSAVWRNGPLYYDYFNKKEWKRESDKKVILKYFLQNLVDELLSEV